MNRSPAPLAAALLAVAALLAAPALPGGPGGRVAAHAELVASAPGAGEVLEEAPDELRLVFSERLEAQGTSADVAAADGTRLLSRAGEVDPEDPYALVVPLPPLEDGTYAVTWRTLSADDGHPAEGFLSFGVGESTEVTPAARDAHHAGPDAVTAAARWFTYPGLLLAIGVPIFHLIALRRGPMPSGARRLLAAALAVASIASLAGLVRAGLDAGALGEYVLGTRNGILLLARAAVAGVGAVTLLAMPGGLATPVAIAAGMGGSLLLVLAGHAAALPGLAGLIGQWLHVVGAGVWLGGVLGLAILLARPGVLVAGTRPSLREVVPRFSALALVAIGLVGLTGVQAAWNQTSTILDPGSEYGATLLLKTVFAAGALALGGLNYLDGGRLRGWLDGMRARVGLETIVIGAVLVGSALLAGTPPRDEPAGVPIEPLPDAFGQVAPDMEMEIVPARPGVNRAVVTTSGGLATLWLSLSLDRLDGSGGTRVPLVLADVAGGHAHGALPPSDRDGATWIADALVLPAGSQWETAVRIQAGPDGAELDRQRFAFTMGDDGVAEGQAPRGLDPALAAGIAALLGGTLAIGAGLGGARLPRTDRAASGVALVAGGAVAAILGAGIGVERLLGI